MNLQRTRVLAIIRGALLAGASLAATAPAMAADPTALTTAQGLYDQAVADMKALDYTKACPKLEEVVRLVPEGVGAKLSLAECYERQGRIASAWTAYQVADFAAARAHQPDRQAVAKQRAAALEPRLARLSILVAPDTRSLPGLVIRRDGVEVGPAQWGVALPLDRGEHVITANATGKRPWETRMTIDKDGGTMTITVGRLDDEARDESPPSPSISPKPAETAPILPKPLPEADGARGAAGARQRMAGLVTGSAGAVSLGLSALLGVVAIVKRDASNDDGHCLGNLCDATGTELRLEGRRIGDASTAMFVIGCVGLATGATLYLTAPRGAPTTISLAPGGVSLSRAW